MAEWDGKEESCSCDCGFDIPKGGCLDALTVKDISGIANLIYPVGSIYMSLNPVNPSTLFGGEWEQLTDRFLIGAGGTYNPNATGGSESHNHVTPVGYNASNKAFGISFVGGSNTGSVTGSFATTGNTVSTGSGTFNWTLPKTTDESHMPPYLAVYMWQRTA